MNNAPSMYARMLITACVVVGKLNASTPSAFAQSAPQRDESVSVDVSADMYIDEAYALQVIVRGSPSVKQPEMPDVPWANIDYRGVNSSSGVNLIINGRRHSSVGVVQHTYSISPKQTGTFIISPISVDVGGRVLKTEPLTITVHDILMAPDFPLAVTVPEKSVYVGQPLPVLLEWRLGRNVIAPSASLPFNGARHDEYVDSRFASSTPRTQAEMLLNGERTIAIFKSGTFSFERIIVPREPGEITIGPARVDFGAAAGQRAPSLRESPVADRTVYERVYSRAEPIRITVIDLPNEGRPANFSGLVGTYSIIAQADVQSVSVGDPINLTVSVTGPAPVSLVPAMDLASSLSGSADFRVPREPILPQISGTSATFRAIIRPRSTSASQIGPISLSYFDPVKRVYASATTAPIALKVAPSTTVSIPDEQTTPDAPSPQESAERALPDGLPDIQRDLVSEAVLPAWLEHSAWRSRWGVLTIASLPAACLLLGGVRFVQWRRSKHPAARRRRAALRSLRRELRRGAEPAHALADFVADWFDKPRGTLTSTEACDLLATLDDPTALRLASMLGRADEPRFAPRVGATDLPSPAEILQTARAYAKSALRRPVQEVA
ncbi:MAG: BatD family protein [Phycisphaerales bacterium]|nr:BatD family protein [Phycisphaerales bacterium]